MDFPADITLRKTRMKFELTFKVVLLFSYQGFVFSFENAYLYYHISKLLSRTFFKNFFFFLRSPFSLSNVNFYILSHDSQSVKKFFHFLLRFLLFSFKNEFLMCNAYYIIITAELRQAFFEDFFCFLRKY